MLLAHDSIVKVEKDARALHFCTMFTIIENAADVMIETTNTTPSTADEADNQSRPFLEEIRLRHGCDGREEALVLVHLVDKHRPLLSPRLVAKFFDAVHLASLSPLEFIVAAKPVFQSQNKLGLAPRRSVDAVAKEKANAALFKRPDSVADR